jgi:hypothetical protein
MLDFVAKIKISHFIAKEIGKRNGAPFYGTFFCQKNFVFGSTYFLLACCKRLVLVLFVTTFLATSGNYSLWRKCSM